MTWTEVDRQLRGLARRRAELDAEELPWLRAAERLEIHVELGYATVLEYLERVLGYTPRVARERMRVARALDALPAVTAALASGRLPMSVVRELVRVAVAETEEAWVGAAIGRTVREVEELVAGRRPGDRPEDPARPDLSIRVLRLEVTPATFALFRQAQQVLELETGERLTDDELVAALARGALAPAWTESGPRADRTHAGRGSRNDSRGEIIDAAAEHASSHQAGADHAGADHAGADHAGANHAGADHAGANHAGADHAGAHHSVDHAADEHAADEHAADEPAADEPAVLADGPAHRVPWRPMHQIATTLCVRCRRGWQDAAGVQIEVGPAAIAQACCDADRIGSLDDDTPARAASEIPPATRRLIWRRFAGRCAVPGCRSARYLEIHHIAPRAQGGGHDAGNLALLCGAHHHRHHDGRLLIGGRSPHHLTFHHADGLRYGAPRDPPAPTPDGGADRSCSSSPAPTTPAVAPAHVEPPPSAAGSPATSATTRRHADAAVSAGGTWATRAVPARIRRGGDRSGTGRSGSGSEI